MEAPIHIIQSDAVNTDEAFFIRLESIVRKVARRYYFDQEEDIEDIRQKAYVKLSIYKLPSIGDGLIRKTAHDVCVEKIRGIIYKREKEEDYKRELEYYRDASETLKIIEQDQDNLDRVFLNELPRILPHKDFEIFVLGCAVEKQKEAAELAKMSPQNFTYHFKRVSKIVHNKTRHFTDGYSHREACRMLVNAAAKYFWSSKH